MQTKITPFSNRVVVKRVDPKANVGSLIIPDNLKEKQARGTVIAVGGGKYTEQGILIPMKAQVGDDVVFGKLAGAEIEVEGEELTIIREDDILIKLN